MRAQIGKLGPIKCESTEREKESLGQRQSQVEHMRWWAEAEGNTRAVLKVSLLCSSRASSVSPANSALLLTAVFVLWIFLHSVPSPFPSPLPPSLSVVGSPPLHRLHPMTFCKHFIREPLVFSKAPRQTDRAAVNRAGGNRGNRSVESFVQNNNVTKLSAALL